MLGTSTELRHGLSFRTRISGKNCQEKENSKNVLGLQLFWLKAYESMEAMSGA